MEIIDHVFSPKNILATYEVREDNEYLYIRFGEIVIYVKQIYNSITNTFEYIEIDGRLCPPNKSCDNKTPALGRKYISATVNEIKERKRALEDILQQAQEKRKNMSKYYDS